MGNYNFYLHMNNMKILNHNDLELFLRCIIVVLQGNEALCTQINLLDIVRQINQQPIHSISV